MDSDDLMGIILLIALGGTVIIGATLLLSIVSSPIFSGNFNGSSPDPVPEIEVTPVPETNVAEEDGGLMPSVVLLVIMLAPLVIFLLWGMSPILSDSSPRELRTLTENIQSTVDEQLTNAFEQTSPQNSDSDQENELAPEETPQETSSRFTIVSKNIKEHKDSGDNNG